MPPLAVLKPAFSSAWKLAVRTAVLAPLFWMPQAERIRIERWLRGREQWQKLRRADLVVVSFGKSGRTWLRVMLSRFYGYRYGFSERSLIGFDNFHLRDRHIPKIFFTHDNYTKDYTGNVDNKSDYYDRKVVLLVRHPADVAVSQYHQWKYRMRPRKKVINAYPREDVDLFTFVARHEAGIGKVIDWMNGWARELPKLPDLLLVRFEDLKADTAGTLSRILAFAGTPGTSEEIAEAVRFGSFENMRKMEAENRFWFAGGRLKAADRANPASYKTRRGEAGGWRKDFPPEQVAEIEAIVESRLLPGFGYLRAERAADVAPAA
ncbi:MAG: sulfotransferase domain-containing protein [Geminicoccaceae bacterium]|nr:sulfotransferase domain-containing protein [Geminicoccaceae bacterium]